MIDDSHGYTLRRVGNVAVLMLDRPHALNAIDDRLRVALLAQFEALSGDPLVAALVLTGRGRAFCAGGDVKRMAERASGAMGIIERRQRIRLAGRLAQRLRELPCPVIAAVNGPAVGLGFSLAMAADVCLAGRSAMFSAAFVRVGLVPDGGLSHLLPAVVGSQRARELLYTGRRVSAEEAVELGIALEVVDDDGLLDRAQGLAVSMTRHSREALALTKELVNSNDGGRLDTAVEREAVAQAVANGSEAHAIAVAAFAERSVTSDEEERVR